MFIYMVQVTKARNQEVVGGELIISFLPIPVYTWVVPKPLWTQMSYPVETSRLEMPGL